MGHPSRPGRILEFRGCTSSECGMGRVGFVETGI